MPPPLTVQPARQKLKHCVHILAVKRNLPKLTNLCTYIDASLVVDIGIVVSASW